MEAAEEAARMKSPITFNMVVLGAFIKVNPVVDVENVIKGLRNSLPQRHHHPFAVLYESMGEMKDFYFLIYGYINIL